MRPHVISLLLATLLSVLPCVLSPGAHGQYLEPEGVLLRDRSSLFVPSNPRAAQQNAATQHSAAGAAGAGRPTLREWWNETDDAPTATPPVAAPSSTAGHAGPAEDTSDEDLELDPVTARWLERIRRSIHNGPPLGTTHPPSTVNVDGTDGTMRHSTALHSGADLAGSGPGEIAVFVTLGGAVAWTLLRSRRMRANLQP